MFCFRYGRNMRIFAFTVSLVLVQNRACKLNSQKTNILIYVFSLRAQLRTGRIKTAKRRCLYSCSTFQESKKGHRSICGLRRQSNSSERRWNRTYVRRNELASIWNGIRRSQGSGCWARAQLLSLLSRNLKCHLLAMAQANLYIILLAEQSRPEGRRRSKSNALIDRGSRTTR
jgi:hypothetical protein